MRKYRQLTGDDRTEIYALKQAGNRQNAIADAIGVNKSLIMGFNGGFRLHTSCYFQLLCPFVWTHPVHIL